MYFVQIIPKGKTDYEETFAPQSCQHDSCRSDRLHRTQAAVQNALIAAMEDAVRLHADEETFTYTMNTYGCDIKLRKETYQVYLTEHGEDAIFLDWNSRAEGTETLRFQCESARSMRSPARAPAQTDRK